MIPESKWKWFGSPGHFICAAWCRFHLCTQIGKYFVSTVGEYVHPRHAQGSEIKESAWLRDHPLGEEIGYGRLFETMVFRVTGTCHDKECGCGAPLGDGQELDCEGYMDRGAATRGHMKMCRKWAEGKARKESKP